MKSVFKPLLLSVLLASAGIVAVAQQPAGQPRHQLAGAMGHQGPMDMAKMQERMASHQAELKAKLQLNAAQESAWANYIAAMQPPADMGTRMGRDNRARMHEEMQALTTPDRIDRMNQLKAQRDAHMAARNDATKSFYAALTPAQQKVFDENSMGGRKSMGRHGDHKGRHHG